MAKKEPQRVENLIEFIEWAAQFNDGPYLFRGVSKDSYEIEASTYRRLTINKTTPQLLEVNQKLIGEARTRGHDQKNGQQLSDLELLAELQHFGAATCLIDFTRSALVALWFACQQSTKGKANGKVFAVRSDIVKRVKTVTPDLQKKDIGYFFRPAKEGENPLYQWEPKLQNNRIIAQHSVFVFGRGLIDADAECIIMLNSKQEILKSLRQLSDITEATVYPDFDGLARLHAHDKLYIEGDAVDYFLRGIAVHQREELDEAIKCYNVVLRLDSDSELVAQAYTHRGLAFQSKDEFKYAIDDFTRLIEISSSRAAGYNYRGIVYRQKGEPDYAICDFSAAIELNSGHIDALYNRAMIYLKEETYEPAVDDFHAIVKLYAGYTQNPIIQYYHGIAWSALGDSNQAKKALTYAKNRGMAIAVRFQEDYGNVMDFQTITGNNLPTDIVEMLTPQQ